MKKLTDIILNLNIKSCIGSKELMVSSLCFDSRKAKKDSMFFAIKGSKSDGHSFINIAINNGTTTIVCEKLPQELDNNITYIETENTNYSLAIVADLFYGQPSKKLKLTGITGTNGKTTLATLSHELFSLAGYKTGLISTVNIKVDQDSYPTNHTTPDPITINHHLNEMVNKGVTHCFMEVSSHGIHQNRIAGLTFSGGVFTNLTHDHLDYHENFKTYRDVKKSFFDNLPSNAFTLTNIDDKNGTFMLQNTKASKKGYSLKTLSDYNAKIIENSIEGLHLFIDGQDVFTQLIGYFNAYNLLAIYSTSRELGIDKTEALKNLSLLTSVAGRFQYFISNKGVTVIVDYAHTPDALQNVLNTIKDIKKSNQKIYTIVGCGGDRDKTKRPIMADISSRISDISILTSDNPRTENPQSIIDDMEKGIKSEYESKTLSILDRKQAIKTASQLSNQGDFVLIAGKGHETYQEINHIKHDFNDFKIAKSIFN